VPDDCAAVWNAAAPIDVTGTNRCQIGPGRRRLEISTPIREARACRCVRRPENMYDWSTPSLRNQQGRKSYLASRNSPPAVWFSKTNKIVDSCHFLIETIFHPCQSPIGQRNANRAIPPCQSTYPRGNGTPIRTSRTDLGRYPIPLSVASTADGTTRFSLFGRGRLGSSTMPCSGTQEPGVDARRGHCCRASGRPRPFRARSCDPIGSQPGFLSNSIPAACEISLHPESNLFLRRDKTAETKVRELARELAAKLRRQGRLRLVESFAKPSR